MYIYIYIYIYLLLTKLLIKALIISILQIKGKVYLFRGFDIRR